MVRIPRLAAAALAALTLCAAVPAAAVYPDKPVRLLMPFPAGGSTDVVARLLSDRLGALWSASLVIENVAGAGANIGNERVAPVGLTATAGTHFDAGKPDAADPADLVRFPKLKLVTVDETFGGWTKAQATARWAWP